MYSQSGGETSMKSWGWLMHYLFHAGTWWCYTDGSASRENYQAASPQAWLIILKDEPGCTIIPLFLRGGRVGWLCCHTCRNFNKTKLQRKPATWGCAGLRGKRGMNDLPVVCPLLKLEYRWPSSKYLKYLHSQIKIHWLQPSKASSF